MQKFLSHWAPEYTNDYKLLQERETHNFHNTRKAANLSKLLKSIAKSLCTKIFVYCNFHQIVWWFLSVRKWLYFLQKFTNRKVVFLFVGKGHLNHWDSKSTIVVWCLWNQWSGVASLLLLKYCIRVCCKLYTNFTILDNLSWEVRRMYYLWLYKGNQDISLCYLCLLHFIFYQLYHISFN